MQLARVLIWKYTGACLIFFLVWQLLSFKSAFFSVKISVNRHSTLKFFTRYMHYAYIHAVRLLYIDVLKSQDMHKIANIPQGLHWVSCYK